MLSRHFKIMCIVLSCSMLLGNTDTEKTQSHPVIQFIKKNRFYLLIVGLIGGGLVYKLMQGRTKKIPPQPRKHPQKSDRHSIGKQADLLLANSNGQSTLGKMNREIHKQEIGESSKAEIQTSPKNKHIQQEPLPLPEELNELLTDEGLERIQEMLALLEKSERYQQEEKNMPTLEDLIERSKKLNYHIKNPTTVDIAQLCEQLTIPTQDPFKILGIAPNASEKEIEDAFIVLATKEWSTNRNSTEHRQTVAHFSLMKACKEKCLEIRKAKTVAL
jgi:hypothetical protein